MIGWREGPPPGQDAPDRARLCAWCGSLMEGRYDAPRAVHGVCRSCLGSFPLAQVEAVHDLSTEDADQLPFGLLQVDDQGTVLRYNRAESELAGRSPEETVGRHFFSEVAPCTRVREFQGRFQRLVNDGKPARVSFTFTFAFKAGDRPVRIVMVHEPGSGTVILVRETDGVG